MAIAQMPFDMLDLMHDTCVFRTQIGAAMLQFGEMRFAFAIVAFAMFALVGLERMQFGTEHFQIGLHVKTIFEGVVKLLQVGNF